MADVASALSCRTEGEIGAAVGSIEVKEQKRTEKNLKSRDSQ